MTKLLTKLRNFITLVKTDKWQIDQMVKIGRVVTFFGWILLGIIVLILSPIILPVLTIVFLVKCVDKYERRQKGWT